MKFQIDHDFHIHSFLSSCSDDPEETPEAILRYGEENGMTALALTDHYWDRTVHGAGPWYRPQDFEHVSRAKPLPQGKNTKFYFGCETEIHLTTGLAIPPERYDDFAWIIIPTTHLTTVGLTITEEDAADPARVAKVWCDRLDYVLSQDGLPFSRVGVAHLACSLISKKWRLEVLDLLTQDALERLFVKLQQRGCGVEINADDFRVSAADAPRVSRIFKIAKACGCKFYLGSDAHHPKGLTEAPELFRYAVDLLDLTEEDKFHPAFLSF